MNFENTFYAHLVIDKETPFIEAIVKQVVPFSEQILISLSKDASDNLSENLEIMAMEHVGKIQIFTHNIESELDLMRQKQSLIDMTPKNKWVLFLEPYDYWPTKSLENIARHYLDGNINALSIKTLKMLDNKFYDRNGLRKWFVKFFKNKPGDYVEKQCSSELFLDLSNLVKHKSYDNKSFYFIPEVYKKDVDNIFKYV